MKPKLASDPQVLRSQCALTPGSPVQTSKTHSTLVLKTKTRDLKMSVLSFHSSFTYDPGAKMSPYPLSKSLAKGTPNSQAASMMAAILAEQNQVEQGSTMSAQCWHLCQANPAGRI